MTLVWVTGNTNEASLRAHRCKEPTQREEAHSWVAWAEEGKDCVQTESSPSQDAW